MDLFTYLGAKKGKFTLPHKSDLFAGLLGKNSKLPVQTESGTTLEITAKKTNVLELTLDKMCSQDGTPTPSDPIPVIVAEGYRNLFSGNYSQFDNTGGTGSTYAYFKLPDDTKQYTLVMIAKNDFTSDSNTYLGFTSAGGTGNLPISWVVGGSASGTINKGTILSRTSTDELRYVSMYTKSATTLQKFVDNFDIMLIEGTELKPYVPYGTNYINLNITDGVNSVNKQIPLNDNFIGGIGDYKDILTIDETGSISLVKNIGRKENEINSIGQFSGGNVYGYAGSIWGDKKQTNNNGAFCNRATLSTSHDENTFYENPLNFVFVGNSTDTLETMREKFAGALVYYVLETPTTAPLGSIDISLFKGTNIITNSDNCNMTIKYY